MTPLRKVELMSGVATGVFGLAISCTLFRPRFFVELLGIIPLYLGPTILVAAGSYFHAVRLKTSGLVILLASGSILTLVMISSSLFGGLFYVYGLRGGLLTLAPSATAILTMITSLLVRRSAHTT
jgi:hypothetical protein